MRDAADETIPSGGRCHGRADAHCCPAGDGSHGCPQWTVDVLLRGQPATRQMRIVSRGRATSELGRVAPRILFGLLALPPARDFAARGAAALAGTDTGRAGRELAALSRANLIHPTTPSRYGMHDLLRLYA